MLNRMRGTGLVLTLSFSGTIFAQTIFVGPGQGSAPVVKVFNGANQTEAASFSAFDFGFLGGVAVAMGDVNGDGKQDYIAGQGVGGGGQVRVFDGANYSEIRSFSAYSGFTGSVNVASGDVDGDGKSDIVTAASGANGFVKVFSGATGALIRSFFSFSGFDGAVTVAAADISGDGKADITVGMAPGGGSQVKVFDGDSLMLLRNFEGLYGTVGANVAMSDANGDGVPDIFVGSATGSRAVKIYDGVTNQQLAYLLLQGNAGGTPIAAAEFDPADAGHSELIAGVGPGPASVLEIYDGVSHNLRGAYFPYGSNYSGGLYLAASSQSPVPEPTTIATICAGMALLTRRRVRKGRSEPRT